MAKGHLQVSGDLAAERRGTVSLRLRLRFSIARGALHVLRNDAARVTLALNRLLLRPLLLQRSSGGLAIGGLVAKQLQQSGRATRHQRTQVRSLNCKMGDEGP